MKILLVNVDSVIPNLALMKISTYRKALGDEVGFHMNMETYTDGEITAKMVLARIFGEGRAIELSDRARKRGVEE